MSPPRMTEKIKGLLRAYFEKSPDAFNYCRDKIALWSNRFEEMEHQIAANRPGPPLPSFPVETRNEVLRKSILESDPVWNRGDEPLPRRVPGMITPEEIRYYLYISAYYSGVGEVVELGPWLGRSTLHILDGLVRNPHFEKRKLHVVDDFVWRSSWMNPNLKGSDISAAEAPENHASFRSLFERFTSEYASRMSVVQAKIADYDGNEHLPKFAWKGGPVELLFVDCGRTVDVNKSWWESLKHSFIPDRTLIVMQDWQVFKEAPRRWYNQTHLFTAERSDELELLHELREGGVGTFLYRGRSQG